ncbi:MAG: PTS sugar transporter subunit IIA [Candidatus Aminicenantales bacterium]
MRNPAPTPPVKIHELLREPLILPDLPADDGESALKEMSRLLAGYDKTFDEKRIYENLLQRESLGSTAIGEGFALPHCKVSGLDEPVIVLAVSQKGVPFRAMDGKPARVFFLVVSSAENPGPNLRVLAAAARLIRGSRSLLKKMLKARTTRTLLDIVREEEEKIS